MDVFEQIVALRREGRPFAVATVVARRPPVSAHLGDRAIVFADGRMEGFIGGACSREIIRAQALEAMQARCGRLVSIRPDVNASIEGSAEHVVVPMTCVSEGAVDVYVEPFIQARRLVVVGATPVADALARIARTMEYDVVRIVDASERRDVDQEAASLGIAVAGLEALEAVLQDRGADQAVVVASQGHYDEQALGIGLKAGPRYFGLVASCRRGASLLRLLEEAGVGGVDAIRSPAGLDLGARTPSEVALSILAEIVQGHPTGAPDLRGHAEPARAAAPAPSVARDPVCGMEVEIATARHTAEHDGVVYYFCCASCRTRFLDNPGQYLQGRS